MKKTYWKKTYWKVHFLYSSSIRVYRKIPLKNIVDTSSPEVKQELEKLFKSRVKKPVENVHAYAYGDVKMCADTKGWVPINFLTDYVRVYAPRVGNGKAAMAQLQYLSAWYGGSMFDILQNITTGAEVKTKASPIWVKSNDPFEHSFFFRPPQEDPRFLELIMKGIIVQSHPIDPHELEIQSSLGLGADYMRSIPPKIDYELLSAMQIKEGSTTYETIMDIVKKKNK